MRNVLTYSFKIKKSLLVFLVFALAISVSAQQRKTILDAENYLQSGNLDSAKVAIDDVMKDSANANDAKANYLKGFIYKEIYKHKDVNNIHSPALEISLQAFEKSIRLDTSKENRDNNAVNIKFLASKIFNGAVSSMDTLHYNTAITDYAAYKNAIRFIEPDHNFAQEDVNFDLALASVFTQKYNSDKQGNYSFLTLARNNYVSVLSVDSNNYNANYNMGISYFNEAVDNITNLHYNIDVVTMDQVQDTSVDLFKKSLPFMEKAYRLKPNRKETIEGLTGIYFSLHDVQKSNEFKAKLDALNKSK